MDSRRERGKAQWPVSFAKKTHYKGAIVSVYMANVWNVGAIGP